MFGLRCKTRWVVHTRACLLAIRLIFEGVKLKELNSIKSKVRWIPVFLFTSVVDEVLIAMSNADEETDIL